MRILSHSHTHTLTLWCRTLITIHINTKVRSLLQYHHKYFPMSLLVYSFNFLFNPFSFKSAISLTFVLYTFVLMYSHTEKIKWRVKSGERGAQEIGPSLPIHLPLNFSFNHVRTSLEKWGGAPSC